MPPPSGFNRGGWLPAGGLGRRILRDFWFRTAILADAFDSPCGHAAALQGDWAMFERPTSQMDCQPRHALAQRLLHLPVVARANRSGRIRVFIGDGRASGMMPERLTS